MTKPGAGLFVIVDPQAEQQVALVKALLIAKLANCRIHAFLCVYRDIKEADEYASRHDFKHSTLTDAEQWLDEQLKPCELAGVQFSKEVVWNRKWYDSTLHSIARSDCDLVIKSSFHHGRARRFFGRTSDYTLMRHCSRPILFAHSTQEWKSGRLLALVDLESKDAQHARLNDVIIRDARAMAEIVGMDLYIATACNGEVDAARLPLSGHGHELNAEKLAELYSVDQERVLLRRGSTVETLKGICNELDPSIVIMGTLARSGIKGKLIGNTAEKLLDQVDADILTVN